MELNEIKFIDIPEWAYNELPEEIKNKGYFYKVSKNTLDENGNIFKEPYWIECLIKAKKQK